MLKSFFSLTIVALIACPIAQCAADTDLARGIALFNSAQYKQAIEQLSKVQSSQAAAPTALYYRALAELKLGRATAGADTFRALIAIYPQASEARLAQTYLDKIAASGRVVASNSALPKHLKLTYREGRDGWLHVIAKVNDQNIDMVWDTGATNCSIPMTAIGHLPPNSKSASIETPSGLQRAWLAPVEIRCGDLKRVALTSVMDGTAVLGQSFFRDYVVEIDRKQHLIYMDLASTADGGTQKHSADSKFQLPFQRESGIMLIKITVDGDQMQAYFDTGCAAKGIAMPRPMAQARPKTVDLCMGPISRKGVKVTIAEGLSRPLVGPAIFGDRDYKIDPVRQVIDFDYVQE
jgi:predicted aspartyl protease